MSPSSPSGRKPDLRRAFHPLALIAVLLLALVWAGISGARLYRQRVYPGPSPVVPLAADKRPGVTVDLTRYEPSNTLDAQLDLMAEAGLVWLRQPFLWAEIEPERGQFRWEPYDRLVEAAAARGFKLIAVLHTSPAWARPARTSANTPPAEGRDFGRFARLLAERYGSAVDAYQIWHEPNLSATWGDRFVDPVAYTWLLREGAINVRAADPTGLILTAALAPTLETGPLNLNDPAYLAAIYAAGGAEWFDVVAAQAYGFDRPAAVHDAAPGELNFARPALLRRVMVEHGDGATPIWLTAFGWNALPGDWAGDPSPWRSLPPDRAAAESESAVRLARANWPWLGPMLYIRWDTAGLAPTDPARGFALLAEDGPTPLYARLAAPAAEPAPATAGFYPADQPGGRYSPGWRLAPAGADSPPPGEAGGPPTLTLPFEGTRLDLKIRRGPFRGFLWVTIDGQPANALPRDESGRSYVVLYDPLAETDLVTLARHLPDGPHRAVIEAEGGWGQWAIAGWRVSREAPPAAATGLIAAGAVAILAATLLLAQALGLLPAPAGSGYALAMRRLARPATAYFTLGEPVHCAVGAALVAAFFLSPRPWVTLTVLGLLGLQILGRPRLGLAVVAFSLSFFLVTKPLPGGDFSLVELATLITAAVFVLRWLWRAARAGLEEGGRAPSWSVLARRVAAQTGGRPLDWLDWAALAFVALALAATLAAGNFGVSMREFRVAVLEPVLFYFMLRGLPAGPRRGFAGDALALATVFLAGAGLHALIALYQYFFTDLSITAEGVHRALGLYGSPNNLALLLDRALPLSLALALLGAGLGRWGRSFYALVSLPIALALYLTFSKGALLLGMPAALAVLLLLGGLGRRRKLALALGGGLLLAAALIPLLGTDRFRSTFDLGPGSTGFFRLRLWQSALAMLRDHPLLGVGLDNFLYQYRTRYILPDAWQEPNLSHPHNLLLDFGTRLGLGGILLLFWLQGGFWRSALRAYRRASLPATRALLAGLMASMAAFLAHGLVDNSYFLVDLAFIFFLSVGLVKRLETGEGSARPAD